MVFRSMALGMILSVVADAPRRHSPCCPPCSSRSATGSWSTKDKDPDRAAEGRWARWTGAGAAAARPHARRRARAAAAARRARRSGCGSACPAPASSTRAASSRDGYDMVVASFGPGAAAPMFVTVPAADAPTVIASALPPTPASPTPASSPPPAANGRVVVRVTPTTAVDDQQTVRPRRPAPRPARTRRPGALVGGPAAQNHDLTAVLTGPRPLAIAVDHDRRVRAAAGRVPQPRRSRSSSILLNLLGVGGRASGSPPSCSSTAGAPA